MKYLIFFCRRPYQDKAETAPLFPPSTSMSPSSMPISSGTATINRTLLHSQQFNTHGGAHARNGQARQGLANFNQGDSPPPTYDDVHDISLQRHGFFFLSFYYTYTRAIITSHELLLSCLICICGS